MISFLIHNPLQPLPNRTKHIPHKQTELLYVLYATSNLHLLKFGVEWYHPINSRILILKTIIMWSITCLIPLEIRIRHIFKKSVLYDIKSRFFHSFYPLCGNMEKVLRISSLNFWIVLRFHMLFLLYVFELPLSL